MEKGNRNSSSIIHHSSRKLKNNNCLALVVRYERILSIVWFFCHVLGFRVASTRSMTQKFLANILQTQRTIHYQKLQYY
jgi:hypothetical protein